MERGRPTRAATWPAFTLTVIKISLDYTSASHRRYRLSSSPFLLQIAYFDKDGDESTGCSEFMCYERGPNKIVISEIQVGKSSFVEEWKNYTPSLNQMRFEAYDYVA
jgi:hypothetical protein